MNATRKTAHLAGLIYQGVVLTGVFSLMKVAPANHKAIP